MRLYCQIIHVSVYAAFFQKIIMGAFFGYAVLGKHYDAVSVLYCRKSVGDGYGGPAFCELGQRFLNVAFAFVVER